MCDWVSIVYQSSSPHGMGLGREGELGDGHSESLRHTDGDFGPPAPITIATQPLDRFSECRAYHPLKDSVFSIPGNTPECSAGSSIRTRPWCDEAQASLQNKPLALKIGVAPMCSAGKTQAPCMEEPEEDA